MVLRSNFRIPNHPLMATQDRKFSAPSLIASLVAGVVVGGFLYSLLRTPLEPVECDMPELLAVFDKDDVQRLLREPDASGARFYLAKNNGMTVVAGPIKRDLSHCPETHNTVFQSFVKLSGVEAEVDMLKEAEAERDVKNSGTANKPTWSMDATKDELDDLLAVSGANAIGVVERRTTTGGWSFDLVAVRISNSIGKVVGTLEDQRTGAPCPLFCGADPALYLHLR